MSDQGLVDMMEREWQSISQLCSSFNEPEWKTPTDCPKWSVQDQLSHMVGSESRLLGRPAPDHTPADLSHVRNESGQRNEIVVDWRRSWPGSKVLEEFREVTAERLKVLRAMTAEDFDAEAQTATGTATVREQLRIRIYDAWVHEQDMRRAVGNPGNLEGPMAEHAMDRTAGAMPYVVGRKVSPADGTTVVFDIDGAVKGTIAVGMEGSRANRLGQPPESPTVSLTMDFQTFTCLGCGRWAPEEVLTANKVQIRGDEALGKTVVQQMAFMI